MYPQQEESVIDRVADLAGDEVFVEEALVGLRIEEHHEEREEATYDEQRLVCDVRPARVGSELTLVRAILEVQREEDVQREQ